MFQNETDRPALITGGAGFIGANLADRLLTDGRTVLLFDNLSRPGVFRNLDWLQKKYGSRVRVDRSDVRDLEAVQKAVRMSWPVFHLAGQVAVTKSIACPSDDFDINAKGTLNVLESLRRMEYPPPLVYHSTNKVYGQLNDIDLWEDETRYRPTDPDVRTYGINEARSLHLDTPYSCSKGAADQYVSAYCTTFNLPTVVLRLSCIYGPLQLGNEHQGWVSHFVDQAGRGHRSTVYGNGKQVRDILHVSDLVEALILAIEKIEVLAGRTFNIGAGSDCTISLLELISLLSKLLGKESSVTFRNWRQADQKYYVSDTRAFQSLTGWMPKVSVGEGIHHLCESVRRQNVE